MCLSVAIERPGDVESRGEHAGLQWVIMRTCWGSRCGYVRVPRGHPWHGRDYAEIDARAHGGLNFAEADVDCREGGDDAWWVGFDTGHAFDLPDPSIPMAPWYRELLDRFRGPPPDAGPFAGICSVKTRAYVEAGCRELCDQAAAAAGVR